MVALDAFRGIAIAGMVLVNNPGSWAYVYAPLRHAEWHGWTPTDLIFPWFLFIVGVSIPLSLGRRLGEGMARSRLWKSVLWRSLILIVLGLAMRAVPDFDFAEMRLYGVLQRIGIVYLVVATMYLWTSERARLFSTMALLLGYWGLLMWTPVPGYGAGDLSPDGNLAAVVDRMLLPGRLWAETWDPEGFLSTLPALATALLGVTYGRLLRQKREANPAKGSAGLAKTLLIHGALLVGVGLAWGAVFPINKNLWTSSYVVFTAGTSLLLLALTHLLGSHSLGTKVLAPLAACGRNAILIFVASGMAAKTMYRLRVGGDSGTSLYQWVYENAFQSWAGNHGGSLAFALVQTAFWLTLAWILHRRRWYVKI